MTVITVVVAGVTMATADGIAVVNSVDVPAVAAV